MKSFHLQWNSENGWISLLFVHKSVFNIKLMIYWRVCFSVTENDVHSPYSTIIYYNYPWWVKAHHPGEMSYVQSWALVSLSSLGEWGRSRVTYMKSHHNYRINSNIHLQWILCHNKPLTAEALIPKPQQV